ncbi:hypothetical protein FRB95_001416 [Tulasnella sp. JGI-2019a]|nr:hypothetical protein FRB95_001416 [Tulasnella sp. JGI-2019a]
MPSPLIFLPFLSRHRGEQEQRQGASQETMDLERAESMHSRSHSQSPSNSRSASRRSQLSRPDDLEPSDDEISGDDEAPDLDPQGQATDVNNGIEIDLDIDNDDLNVREQPVTRRNIEFHPETMEKINTSSPRKMSHIRLRKSVPFRRFNSTTSSEFSWNGTENTELTPGWFVRVMRKIGYFIFQNSPEDKAKEEAGTPNYRYLPILSGCISPFAILLEIPGLTEHWYVRTENNRVVEYRENPAILDVGMAISMACAVIANAALIARFLEHRVKFFTLTCMLFLIIHDLINVTTVTIFGVIHRFNDGFTYGEAFWMIVISTICSVICTVTLAFDLITTNDFAHSGSGLTRKQRSLIIMVMILISYIALGSLAFSLLLNLTFQDGLYFTVVTIETIGFGDIHPVGTGSTVFCIFYATFGIVNIGLVVNTTRETIIEAFQNEYRRRATEVARRRHEHKVSRMQENARRAAIERQLKEAGLPLYVRDGGGHFHHHLGGGRGGAVTAGTLAGAKWVLNEKGLERWQKEKAEKDRKGVLAMGGMGDQQEASLKGSIAETDAMKGRTFQLAKALERNMSRTTTEEDYDRLGSEKQLGTEGAEAARRVAIERRLKDAGLPVYVRVGGEHVQLRTGGGRGGAAASGTLAGVKWVLNEKALEKWQKEKADRGEGKGVLDLNSISDQDEGSSVVGGEADTIKGKMFQVVERDVTRTTSAEVVYGDLGTEKEARMDTAAGTPGRPPFPTFPTFDSIRESEFSEESYIEFRKRIKKEESREFITKLVVAISLFFIFWFVGAGIFVAAEKWPYGRSLYFCWMAFSTLGYGEVTPVTPAGRAIFVVWALMGVAAMTILISVLSEAYSSRYQSALKNGTFSRAIRSFEDKQQQQRRLEVENLLRQAKDEQDRADDQAAEDGPEGGDTDAIVDDASNEDQIENEKVGGDGNRAESLAPSSPMQTLRVPHHQASGVSLSRTPTRQPSQPSTPSPVRLATAILADRRERLDSIPLDVIQHAKSFHDHVRYFAHHPKGSSSGQPGIGKEPPPREFHELLEEIAQSERMDERMKQEMLSDDEARRALFFMSYDRAFKRLIDTAENAVKLIARKDAEWANLIDVLKEREDSEGRNILFNSGDGSRSDSPAPGFDLPQTSSPASFAIELSPVAEHPERPATMSATDGVTEGVRQRISPTRQDSDSTTRYGHD